MNKFQKIVYTLFVSYFLFLVSCSAFAAQIYLLPQTAEMGVGDSLLSELRIDTEGEQLNAFDILMTYPVGVLEISDVITGGSLINLWIHEPVYSNEHGILRIEGGRIGGLAGDGLLLKILFKGKSIGTGTVSFDDVSQVLLHDGFGTPAVGVFSAARYLVREEIPQIVELKSGTHPTEDQWYQAKKIDVQWEPREGAVYSYILSIDVMENPDNEPEEDSGGHVSYANPGDGIYHFSIQESMNGGETWSDISRYRFLQDRSAPEKFEILIAQDESVYGGQYFATFAAEDKTSGLDHYEIQESTLPGLLKNKEWVEAESPQLLVDQASWSIIRVKAVDKAGNERIAKHTPVKVRVTEIGLLFVVITFAFVAVKKFF